MEENKIPKLPPADYREILINGGSIERLDYDTESYDERALKVSKHLNVYLPKGYDTNDTEKRYNVFYLMHGGGENEDFLFEGPGANTELKCIVDHMISKQDIEPMIIVTPTFNVEGNTDLSFLVRNFYHELVNDIMPAVESIYHTYAREATTEGFKASRTHRAFGGFSMGSACTWYVYSHCLDFFKYYMPLSGDCWQYADKGGALETEKTALFLAEVARNSGYAPTDYDIFCSTGDEDIAYPNLLPQIEEMKKYTDVFHYAWDGNEGNLRFHVTKGTTHWWHYVYDYIYDSLPYFFR